MQLGRTLSALLITLISRRKHSISFYFSTLYRWPNGSPKSHISNQMNFDLSLLFTRFIRFKAIVFLPLPRGRFLHVATGPQKPQGQGATQWPIHSIDSMPPASQTGHPPTLEYFFPSESAFAAHRPGVGLNRGTKRASWRRWSRGCC